MADNFENEFDKIELAKLIDTLIDGTISEPQFRQLTQKINGDPAARKFYIATMEIEFCLQGLSRAVLSNNE